MTRNESDPSLRELDTMSAEEIVSVIQREDARIVPALISQHSKISAAVEAIADRMHHGGKLVYAGAGTSGRIAMLDAAELPPTYGIDPALVQVIVAGGEEALFRAVEGAEDREEDAIAEVGRRVTSDDTLIGIASSGTTPFTVAAVRKANMLGALTIGVTSVAGSPLSREADIPIVVETGAEVILGSTRMKSGTAQKMVLNTISTAVMIRLGRVYSNMMVDMPPTNRKLWRRATEMIEVAAEVGREQAEAALRECDGNVRAAIVVAKFSVSCDEARRLLSERGGDLRKVLQA